MRRHRAGRCRTSGTCAAAWLRRAAPLADWRNGYDVAFIRNVTDIDDKILNKAADAGRPWWEWAATYERAFTAAYDALGVLPPSAEPRATGHITQMVELMRAADRQRATPTPATATSTSTC